MTPRSIFLIILKVIGLFLLRDALYSTYRIIAFTITVASSTPVGSGSSTFLFDTGLAGSAAVLLCYLIFIFLFFFKTNMIIDMLKLDRGFDQQLFNFNTSITNALTIALVIMAGVALLNEIPSLCRDIFVYALAKKELATTIVPASDVFFSAVKIVLCLLVIGERRRIVNLMEKGRVN